MKKLINRMITVLVIITMAASLPACVQSAVVSPQPSQPGSSAKASPDVSETAETPVTLKFAGINGISGSGVKTDPVMQQMAKDTGVTLDFIDTSGPDKFKILLAAGDLPDIMSLNGDFKKQVIEGKQVIELDALIQTNGQNILENAPVMIEFNRKYASNDTGKLYFVSANQDDQGDCNAIFTPWIRWDYYKELGYPEIKTYDDLLDVCAQMIEKHPTTEDGKKVYAFTEWMEWGIGFGLGNPGGVLEKAQGGASGLFMYFFTENRFKSAITTDDSAYWKGAELFNKANRLGIFDPETFTHNGDVAGDKHKNNRYVCAFQFWSVANNKNDFKGKGEPEKGYMPLPPVAGAGAYWGQAWPVGAADRMLCISSSCKTPARAMDMLNYLWSFDAARLAYNGIKDVHYKLEDGVLDWTDETKQQQQTDKDFGHKTGIGNYNNIIGLGPNVVAPDGQTLNLQSDPTALALNAKKAEAWPLLDDYAQKYGIDRFENTVNFRQLAEKYSNGSPYMFRTLAQSIATPDPDDIKRLDAALEKYVTTSLVTLVMTAKTDEEFAAGKQEIIDELMKMGLQTSLDWHQANYDKAVAASNEILGVK